MKICEEIVENANKRKFFFCLVSYIICLINLEIIKFKYMKAGNRTIVFTVQQKEQEIESESVQYSLSN